MNVQRTETDGHVDTLHFKVRSSRGWSLHVQDGVRACDVFNIAVMGDWVKKGNQMLRVHIRLSLQCSLKELDGEAWRFVCEN